MTAYTSNKLYPLQAIGSNVGRWGLILNNQMFSVVDNNLGGRYAPDLTGSGDFTVNDTNAEMYRHELSGTLAGDRNYILPNRGGFYTVSNACTGDFNLTIKTTGITGGISLPNDGKSFLIYINVAGNSIDVAADVQIAINARDPKYGLSGLGLPGDGAKLITAFNDALAGPRILYIPAGSYLLDSFMTTQTNKKTALGIENDPEGVTIIGDGIQRTILQFPDATVAPNGVFWSTNSSFVSLARFTIDATGSRNGNGIAIRTDGNGGTGENYHLEEIEMIKTYNAAVAVTNSPAKGYCKRIIIRKTVQETHDHEAHGFDINNNTLNGFPTEWPDNWTFEDCEVYNPSGGCYILQGVHRPRLINCIGVYEAEYIGDRNSSGYHDKRLGNGVEDAEIIGGYGDGMARGIRAADTDGLTVSGYICNNAEYEAILDLKQNLDDNKGTPNNRHVYSGIVTSNAQNSPFSEGFGWLRGDVTEGSSVVTNLVTMDTDGDFIPCNPGSPPSGVGFLSGNYYGGGGFERESGARVGVVNYTPYDGVTNAATVQIVDGATDLSTSLYSAGTQVPATIAPSGSWTSLLVVASGTSVGVQATVAADVGRFATQTAYGNLILHRYSDVGGTIEILPAISVSLYNDAINSETGAYRQAGQIARSAAVQNGTAFQSFTMEIQNTGLITFDLGYVNVGAFLLGSVLPSLITRDEVKCLSAPSVNQGNVVWFQGGNDVGIKGLTNVTTNGRTTDVIRAETLQEDAPLRGFWWDSASCVSYGQSAAMLRTASGYMFETQLQQATSSSGSSYIRQFDNSSSAGFSYFESVRDDTFVPAVQAGSLGYVTGDLVNLSDQSEVQISASSGGVVSAVTTYLSRIPKFYPPISANGAALSQALSGTKLDLTTAAWYTIPIPAPYAGTPYANMNFGMPVTAPAGQKLTLTAAATDLSGITFTVTGTNWAGTVITETLAGPGANTTVSSAKYYVTITEIAYNATSVGTVSAGGAGLVTEVGQTINLTGTGQVIIVSGGDDSDIVFTITGSDINGRSIHESLAGANGGAALAQNPYATVTSITHTGTVGGTLEVGITGAADAVCAVQSPGAGAILINGSLVSGGVAYVKGAGLVIHYTRTPVGSAIGVMGRNGQPAYLGSTVQGVVQKHVQAGTGTANIVAAVELDGAIEGGSMQIKPSAGTNIGLNVRTLGTSSLILRDGNNNPVVQVKYSGAASQLAFFNGAVATKQTITGALSTVADAPAKAVLTSIIAALTAYGLVTDGTT